MRGCVTRSELLQLTSRDRCVVPTAITIHVFMYGCCIMSCWCVQHDAAGIGGLAETGGCVMSCWVVYKQNLECTT